MAIKINNDTVIDNNKRGDFSSMNISSYTTAQLANQTVTGISTGDAVYDSTQNKLVFWSGSEWVGLGTNIIATGGNLVEEFAGYRNHIFTSPGTFTIGYAGEGTSNTIELILVGGGGGGGRQGGGGGGGGDVVTYTISNADVQSQEGVGIAVTIGAGGRGGLSYATPDGNGSKGAPGGDSFFGNIQFATGGGGGGALNLTDPNSRTALAGDPANFGAGGGGGGAAYRQGTSGGGSFGGYTNGRPGNYSYDNYFTGGAGGGADGMGSPNPSTTAGAGGIGKGFDGLPTSVGTDGGAPVGYPARRYFAAGGTGTSWSNPVAGQTKGGGGAGTGSRNVNPQPNLLAFGPQTNAVANTGSGGGGYTWDMDTMGTYGNGADGIAIVRYQI